MWLVRHVVSVFADMRNSACLTCATSLVGILVRKASAALICIRALAEMCSVYSLRSCGANSFDGSRRRLPAFPRIPGCADVFFDVKRSMDHKVGSSATPPVRDRRQAILVASHRSRSGRAQPARSTQVVHPRPTTGQPISAAGSRGAQMTPCVLSVKPFSRAMRFCARHGSALLMCGAHLAGW